MKAEVGILAKLTTDEFAYAGRQKPFLGALHGDDAYIMAPGGLQDLPDIDDRPFQVASHLRALPCFSRFEGDLSDVGLNCGEIYRKHEHVIVAAGNSRQANVGIVVMGRKPGEADFPLFLELLQGFLECRQDGLLGTIGLVGTEIHVHVIGLQASQASLQLLADGFFHRRGWGTEETVHFQVSAFGEDGDPGPQAHGLYYLADGRLDLRILIVAARLDKIDPLGECRPDQIGP